MKRFKVGRGVSADWRYHLLAAAWSRGEPAPDSLMAEALRVLFAEEIELVRKAALPVEPFLVSAEAAIEAGDLRKAYMLLDVVRARAWPAMIPAMKAGVATISGGKKGASLRPPAKADPDAVCRHYQEKLASGGPSWAAICTARHFSLSVRQVYRILRARKKNH